MIGVTMVAEFIGLARSYLLHYSPASKNHHPVNRTVSASKEKELDLKILTAALLLVCLTNSPAWTQPGIPSSPREIAAYGGPDRERLLFEGAKREGKLVWYTTLAAVQNKQIAATFEAKYPGLRVEAYRAGSSALVQRLINELRPGAISPTPSKRPCPVC